jgi:hypothetical protein
MPFILEDIFAIIVAIFVFIFFVVGLLKVYRLPQQKKIKNNVE